MVAYSYTRTGILVRSLGHFPISPLLCITAQFNTVPAPVPVPVTMIFVSWLCVQCIYLALTFYVGITLYGCITSASRVIRIRRMLLKNFAGDSGSFFFAKLLSMAENAPNLYDVSISKMPFHGYI